MRVQLVPLDGGDTLEIKKDLVLVGRKEDCDLYLPHKSVSKAHCVIVRADGALFLRDLGSTNGTRVNGQRIRRAAVLPNDQVHIASLRYRVEFTNAPVSKIRPEEHTQCLDASEVAELLKKGGKGEPDDSAPDIEMPPIQANALPDVYPGDAPQPPPQRGAGRR